MIHECPASSKTTRPRTHRRRGAPARTPSVSTVARDAKALDVVAVPGGVYASLAARNRELILCRLDTFEVRQQQRLPTVVSAHDDAVRGRVELLDAVDILGLVQDID